MQRKKTITNTTINKIHRAFKNYRDDLYKFFRLDDQSLIRFSFGETPDYYQFKVKFGASYKSVKFVVLKDTEPGFFHYTMYEKTKNIIMDIDNIYRERESGQAHEDDLPNLIRRLFFWCIRKNENRENETFFANGVQLVVKDGKFSNLKNDVLYIDLITSFCLVNKEESQELKKQSFFDKFKSWCWKSDSEELFCKFNLLNTEPIILPINKSVYKSLNVNKILVVNYLHRYNVMSFTAAKHHINFADLYKPISNYLLSCRGNYGNKENH